MRPKVRLTRLLPFKLRAESAWRWSWVYLPSKELRLFRRAVKPALLSFPLNVQFNACMSFTRSCVTRFDQEAQR